METGPFELPFKTRKLLDNFILPYITDLGSDFQSMVLKLNDISGSRNIFCDKQSYNLFIVTIDTILSNDRLSREIIHFSIYDGISYMSHYKSLTLTETFTNFGIPSESNIEKISECNNIYSVDTNGNDKKISLYKSQIS